MSASAPIGVFDSGLGGLTVVHALRDRLPHESIVYLGDTARVPYGPKSPETVRRYADEIARWLLAQHVKLIVVACNTATAHALPQLRASMPVPVIGVIEPGARAAAQVSRGHIGVIGTAGTIRSGAYRRAIAAQVDGDRGTTVVEQPCPLFVPLVEEGWLEHPVTEAVAREYLAPLMADGVDTLVLGCTHYPLLAPVLSRVMPPGTTLIDSAAETAREVEHVLHTTGAAAPLTGPHGSLRLAATDAPESFAVLAARFLGGQVPHVEHITLG
ncbi:MAG: glutamate racemase [Gemmatimonadaceae bacterium]|nr:glutamate racemase [Gemmatimonadaceae bacterium]